MGVKGRSCAKLKVNLLNSPFHFSLPTEHPDQKRILLISSTIRSISPTLHLSHFLLTLSWQETPNPWRSLLWKSIY